MSQDNGARLHKIKTLERKGGTKINEGKQFFAFLLAIELSFAHRCVWELLGVPARYDAICPPSRPCAVRVRSPSRPVMVAIDRMPYTPRRRD